MKKNSPKLLLFAIGIALLSSCLKDKGKPEQAAVIAPGSVDTCSTDIKYSKQVSSIITTYCAIPSCHVPTGYKDFSTYSAFKGEVDQVGKTFILNYVNSGGMPQGLPKLSACNIQKLEAWLNAGAPNN